MRECLLSIRVYSFILFLTGFLEEKQLLKLLLKLSLNLRRSQAVFALNSITLNSNVQNFRSTFTNSFITGKVNQKSIVTLWKTYQKCWDTGNATGFFNSLFKEVLYHISLRNMLYLFNGKHAAEV